jgi:hypothetical protein
MFGPQRQQRLVIDPFLIDHVGCAHTIPTRVNPITDARRHPQNEYLDLLFVTIVFIYIE